MAFEFSTMARCHWSPWLSTSGWGFSKRRPQPSTALWLKLKLEVADVPCIVPCPQDRKVRNHYLSGILLFYLFGGCYMYILSSHKTSNTVWWFESFFVFFHILGMSSSQLTFIFFGGVGIPPTSKLLGAPFQDNPVLLFGRV